MKRQGFITGSFFMLANCLFVLMGCMQSNSLPTFQNEGNPLIKDKFTADPAPMVHNGKLYLYVGHDEYYDGQDKASGGKEFNITEWLCYSTDDLQTWTDHGSILKPTDFKWAIGEAWASYHNAMLTIDGHAGAIGRRSVCVEELHYNSDGTMAFVKQTSEGIANK